MSDATKSNATLLTTKQMAQFAARGFLRFDGVVPDSLNKAFLDDIGHSDSIAGLREHYANIIGSSAIPFVNARIPFRDAYPPDSTLGRILALPQTAGAVQSLVGSDCLFDHHFLHITFPPSTLEAPHPAQQVHQDSTIDPRRAFDVQIFYYPQDVTPEMGGTRFVPGTHLRIVSEGAIARYQNIRGQQHVVCPAGTLLVVHSGIWHGGGANRSDQIRYMFKIRLCPTRPQERLWDTSDLDTQAPQRAIAWEKPRDPDDVHTILTEHEPWFEGDTGRIELINRIRFWRYLTGDENFDADFWAGRVENEQVRSA